MVQILDERVSARIDGDFVVFLIGMRVNKLWKVHKWLPPALAMMRMQRQLAQLPVEETGCLGTIAATPGLTVQYWRSFDHLERFAHDTAYAHIPAWGKFNKAAKGARGDVGIWHETYLVREGAYESLYSGMPLHGLGKAASVVPAVGAMSAARKRIGAA